MTSAHGKIYLVKNKETIKTMNMLKFAMAALFAVFALGCSEKPKLYVYTWADYIDPGLIQEFEKENGCQVVIDTFDSNEAMFAKLMAGGQGYDVLMPTEYMMRPMVEAGLVSKLDPEKLPNARKNVDGKFKTEWTFEYDVPYAFSCIGVLWRKDKIPAGKEFKDWEELFDPDLGGRVCMMNDVREIIGLGLKVNGYSVNSTNDAEIAKAVETARRWKGHVSKMDNEAYRTGVPAGEFVAAMAYNSDAIMLLADDQETLGYSVPTNGAPASVDVMCVAADSKSKDLAYKFIDMFYSLPNAVRNAEYNGTPMPVSGLYDALSDKYKAIPFMRVSEELRARCEDIKDVGPALEKYSKAWDAVKRQ